MYENNYPNQYGQENRESNSFSYQSNTAASGGSAYTTGNTYHYEEQKKAPEKPKKQKSGSGRKIALGICCGLLFGIFAGLGFEAVNTASDLVKGKVQAEQETTAIPKTKTDSQAEPAIKEAKPLTGTGEEVKETPAKEEEAEDIREEVANTAALFSDSTESYAAVMDVRAVVKEVMPAVVSVNNKYVETMSFFGEKFSNEGISAGSGIIVGQNDTELLIATNYHVVESAEELTVQFVDGSQALAQTKGADADKDLSVIAVQLSDIDSSTKNQIAVATLGNSDKLEVGEPVIAIGNALGYGQSVTTGVVSALNRELGQSTMSTKTSFQGDKEVNTFIQTDAAINPGNSGGALLNIRGEVIGINSNKFGGSAVEGMGYAIPISDAQPIIEELMSKETKLKVPEENKGFLGITGIDVVEEYSQIYGIPQGVYVSSVTEGTGAAAAGLIKGDIITALNGEEVKSMDDLKNELNYYTAGTTVELTIMQGSPTGYQEKTVEVTLGALPR